MTVASAPSKASHLDPASVIAVIGYRGSARTAAKNLVAAGHDVRVAVRPGGMSWVRAFEDGFRPVSIAEAVPGATIIVVAVPELEQSQLFATLIEKHLAPGSLVLLESTAAAVAAAGGFNLAQQTVKSPVAAVKPDPELPPGVIL